MDQLGIQTTSPYLPAIHQFDLEWTLIHFLTSSCNLKSWSCDFFFLCHKSSKLSESLHLLVYTDFQEKQYELTEGVNTSVKLKGFKLAFLCKIAQLNALKTLLL